MVLLRVKKFQRIYSLKTIQKKFSRGGGCTAYRRQILWLLPLATKMIAGNSLNFVVDFTVDRRLPSQGLRQIKAATPDSKLSAQVRMTRKQTFKSFSECGTHQCVYEAVDHKG